MKDFIMNLSKKQKKIIISAAAVIVIGGGVSCIAYQSHVNQIKAEAQQLQESKYQTLSKSISKLTDGDYLATDVNLAQIDKLDKKIQAAKKDLADTDFKKLNSSLLVLKQKLAVQNQVNALFKAPAINGSKVASQSIQDNLTAETVDKIKLEELKKGDFKTALEKLKSEAKAQIKKVADDKAQAEKAKADADAKAKQETEANAQAQAAAQAEAQQQATEQANAQAQQASQQANAGTSTAGDQSSYSYSGGSNSGYTGATGGTQAQGGTTSQAQSPSTSGNGGYTYHTPTQDELNQSAKEASEKDYSHLDW